MRGGSVARRLHTWIWFEVYYLRVLLVLHNFPCSNQVVELGTVWDERHDNGSCAHAAVHAPKGLLPGGGGAGQRCVRRYRERRRLRYGQPRRMANGRAPALAHYMHRHVPLLRALPLYLLLSAERGLLLVCGLQYGPVDASDNRRLISVREHVHHRGGALS